MSVFFPVFIPRDATCPVVVGVTIRAIDREMGLSFQPVRPADVDGFHLAGIAHRYKPVARIVYIIGDLTVGTGSLDPIPVGVVGKGSGFAGDTVSGTDQLIEIVIDRIDRSGIRSPEHRLICSVGRRVIHITRAHDRSAILKDVFFFQAVVAVVANIDDPVADAFHGVAFHHLGHVAQVVVGVGECLQAVDHSRWRFG